MHMPQSQTPVAAPPAPPAPPTPPSPPSLLSPQAPARAGAVQPSTFQNFSPGDPLSEAHLEQLAEIREMLSSQLISSSERRNEVAQQLRNATGADREGMEQRLRQLDARILQLEADIEHTGRLLTSAPPATSEGILVPPPRFVDFPRPEGPNMTAIGVVFMLFVLAPIAIAIARLIWRRATGQAVARPTLESTQRMERVEQAIDSIAVEVERISEGQRFVTRILTEGSAQSVLNAGRAEQVAPQRREGVKVPRGED